MKFVTAWIMAGGVVAAATVSSVSLIMSAVMLGITMLGLSVYIGINANAGIGVGERFGFVIFGVMSVSYIVQLVVMLTGSGFDAIVLTAVMLGVQLYLLHTVLFYFAANRLPRLDDASRI